MEKSIWVIIAFLAGAILPIQAGMNSKLAKSGGSPVHASMIASCLLGKFLLCGGYPFLTYLYLVDIQQCIDKRAQVGTGLCLGRRAFGGFLCDGYCLCFPENRPGAHFWSGGSRPIAHLNAYGAF